MNDNAVEKEIKLFLRRNRRKFSSINRNQSKFLQLAVTVAAAEHYRANGYSIRVENPRESPTQFVVKSGARGYPWNFSRFVLERDRTSFEAHMKLLVGSAHDEGKYCVDLGVTKLGAVPEKKPGATWECVKNKNLITFAEVKNLVVYPTVLAQFLGIVHELKPAFIGGRTPPGFIQNSHMLPALASLGNFAGNSSKIVAAYKRRNIRVNIAQNFDVQLANLRGGEALL